MSRWVPRLARLSYWLACSSVLCLVWMALVYPTHPKRPPSLPAQFVWWTLCLYAPLSVLISTAAYIWIRERTNQRTGRVFAEAGMVVGLSACVVIAFASLTLTGMRLELHHRSGAKAFCLSNVKQVSLGTLIYVEDYDEQYPPASSWHALTMPYVKNEQVYRCPEEEDPSLPSYGMNSGLSKVQLATVEDPAKTVLIIDTVPGANRAVTKADYPFTDRHGPYITVGFADGHAKQPEIAAVRDLTWEMLPAIRTPAPAKKVQ